MTSTLRRMRSIWHYLRMTFSAEQYRTALATLKLSHSQAGKITGVDVRTSRRFASGRLTVHDDVADKLRNALALHTQGQMPGENDDVQQTPS